MPRCENVDLLGRHPHIGSEEIKLLRICTHIVKQREPMGFGPGWIGSLPAKASEVSTALGVEDHALLFKQLLLVASCTDFALRVDDTLPGHRWLWRAIAQGCHSIAHLPCCHR